LQGSKGYRLKTLQLFWTDEYETYPEKDHSQQELFRSRLDQIINMNHPLVKLSKLLI